MKISWDDLPFPLILVDQQTRILSANPRAAFELEADQQSLLGRPLAEVIDPLPSGLQFRPLVVEGRPCRVLTWSAASKPQGNEKKKEAPVEFKARILVAEDEDSIRDICRRVLTDAGYQVLVAVNGQAAIDILSERGGQVDLILADVVMPVAGGEAISEFLRTAELKIPIIYTSGYALRSGPADFLQGEAVTLLRKPYSLSQLLATVKNALEAG